MSAAWGQLGDAVRGGALLIADHASNQVPSEIDLGIADALLGQHIASDIGVAGVAERLVAVGVVDCAILGGVSRLVVDCNRAASDPAAIPASSDGQVIPGNAQNVAERADRIARYHTPYHAHIASVIAAAPPAMIVSLHSFTPVLASAPEVVRPWQIGVLYNRDDRLARVALAALAGEGLVIGDQQPYSGRDLNHTMDVHAEANGIPYVGIELRQDLVADADGEARMAAVVAHCIAASRAFLAHGPASA